MAATTTNPHPVEEVIRSFAGLKVGQRVPATTQELEAVQDMVSRSRTNFGASGKFFTDLIPEGDPGMTPAAHQLMQRVDAAWKRRMEATPPPQPEQEPARPVSPNPYVDTGPTVPARFNMDTLPDWLTGKWEYIHAEQWALQAASGKEADWPDTGLFICGPDGTGKTGTAAAIATIAGDPVHALFMDANELAQTIYRDRKAGDDRLKKRVEGVRVLVIDDLGEEDNVDWLRSIIDNLLKRRHANRKLTVATSNLSPSTDPPPGLTSVADRYGPRIHGRITESMAVLAMTGENMRTAP